MKLKSKIRMDCVNKKAFPAMERLFYYLKPNA